MMIAAICLAAGGKQNSRIVFLSDFSKNVSIISE